MELWIRSQDKTILSKVSGLLIRENRNENNKVNYVIQEIYTMGIYKTKERALEVLDEIQKRLTSCWVVNGLGEYKAQANVIIYEMPKE